MTVCSCSMNECSCFMTVCSCSMTMCSCFMTVNVHTCLPFFRPTLLLYWKVSTFIFGANFFKISYCTVKFFALQIHVLVHIKDCVLLLCDCVLLVNDWMLLLYDCVLMLHDCDTMTGYVGNFSNTWWTIGLVLWNREWTLDAWGGAADRVNMNRSFSEHKSKYQYSTNTKKTPVPVGMETRAYSCEVRAHSHEARAHCQDKVGARAEPIRVQNITLPNIELTLIQKLLTFHSASIF